MTQFRQTIQDLKPNTRYLAKVLVNDKNISTIIAEKSFIFETPGDETIPGSPDIANFFLYSNSKSVMFKFDAPTDKDLVGYDYQIYSTNSLTTLLQERI
jgi:hypothetical protein